MNNMMCSRCKKRVAVVYMTRMEGDKTINEGLCLQCAKELGIKPINDLVEKMGLSEDDMAQMDDQLMEMMNPDGDENFEMGGAQPFPFLQNFFGGGQPLSTGGVQDDASTRNRDKKDKKEKEKKRKYLDQYTENLTKKAADGKVDLIVGRDSEIQRVIQILNRRTKNNACLIGEPGVGKTAIAEGIAQRIVQGSVPPKMLDKELHLLDLTGLIAGTQFRGQFESRMKGLVEEVRDAGNIILFIDEVHNLVGAGDSEGSMNAANILKPALSRGEIQVIGATTFEEYRKYIEKDAALERRFQPVTVNEPSIADTMEMLKGIKGYYEKYHHVKVSDEIVHSAVTMSERYITDRFLPDKAIDLLDEGCSCASLRNKELAEYDILNMKYQKVKDQEKQMEQSTEQVDYEKMARIKAELIRIDDRIKELEPAALNAAVTHEDLAHVIELWTGIPASKIEETELAKVARLEPILKKKIIGQDEAVELVAAAVRRSRVQVTAKRRPASFIFVGPTGVGKTELVKVLSQELFDNTDPLIRLDMSEFMEKHSVSRIVGSPPGYVGYDEAGQLTEKVRRKPYSVVLFDEIEKAHPDVMNILLQILDEGRITDAHGRTVSFENTVIVMTSNAGSERREGTMGFEKRPGDVAKERAHKALSEFLRPEFLGRVDEIVVFRALDENDYQKIAALMLNELTTPLADKGIKFVYDDNALSWIAQKAYGKKSGARDLRRVIRKNVEDAICNMLVERLDAPPAGIKVTVQDGELKLLTI
ncbi:ATP-dependent Clp protease ATP-binding subunit ClpA [Hydrogenoanaerobacterium saccharovorans]|uniref:ATP-dependent Clp protease ATP-binding subunit ClpA n=2 Tax=Hydrogenoanaerobacterium saccharovorans TaxID=474960 RepID=A0A1H8AZN9_9FIRM|nr:ATP-dependent Clp protease ATP-binding subunit ClpA [Hydrogenoanaerobacterium saccharovorans]SEM76195.1 ATP-dependent Clp protease ATP-binding subunit ClpA [Hydrogenoanaerobacterium saccharovorans]